MSAAQTRLVFVHGIWMKGFEMGYLRRYFATQGYPTQRFSYRSISRTLQDNAERLFQALQAEPKGDVMLIAHSLGGIVVRLMFERHSAQLDQVKAVVSLGSPLQGGSQVARFASERRLLRWTLGASDAAPLLTGVRHWDQKIPWLSIAGTHCRGVGRYTGSLNAPGDGTVAITETQLPGIRQHIKLPVSHTGMLFSKPVAHAIHGFLQKI